MLNQQESFTKPSHRPRACLLPNIVFAVPHEWVLVQLKRFMYHTRQRLAEGRLVKVTMYISANLAPDFTISSIAMSNHDVVTQLIFVCSGICEYAESAVSCSAHDYVGGAHVNMERSQQQYLQTQ